MKKLITLIFVIAALISASCAKSTRTITPLTQSDRSKIKKIAIFVDVDEEFDASVESLPLEGPNIIGILIFSIIGYFITEHQNKKHENIFKEQLTEFHIDELFSDRLKYYLESSNAGFTAEVSDIKSADTLKAKGFDTILEVNLKEWGIVHCTAATFTFPGQKKVKVEEYEDSSFWDKLNKSNKLIRSRIKLSGKILSIDDNNTLWEREELYTDNTCNYLEDVKSHPELLVNMLTRSIQSLAENTVKEFLLSENNE